MASTLTTPQEKEFIAERLPTNKPWRLSLTTVLTVGFGALIVVAVVSVLLVGLYSGQRNTEDLVRDKAVLIVTSVAERTRQHLAAARAQSEYLAALVADGTFNPADRRQLIPYLTASQAAAPQVHAIIYLDQALQSVRLHRSDAAAPVSEDWSGNARAVSILAALRQAKESYWGELVYLPERSSTIFNILTPVRRDGIFLGAFVASVLIDELSDYLKRLNTGYGGLPFILYGNDEVLSHPSLAQGFSGLSEAAPLPTLEQIDDPVLRAIWNPDKTEPIDELGAPGFDAHFVHTEDGAHVVLYERLYGFGLPWIVGSHFRAEDIGAEFKRLDKAAYIGVAVLVLAVLAALFSARWISLPVKRLAGAASRIRELGPQQIAPLPPSRFAELDAATRAFNAMTEGLRERELIRDIFGKYVPGSIADAILQDRGMLQAQTRLATILFTDIEGFSTIAEAMAPERLIAMLNEYFSVVIEPIERNGGVIHQFQGDAILATYNLPVEDPQHAQKAVRTALEIQAVLAEQRFADGVALATRVGINTGTIVGGTVGAAGRLGYTVHGDDVNLAARIEQLNKQYGTRILVAQSTVELAGPLFPFEPIGELPIRGRQRSVMVYRIAESHDLA